MKSMRFLLPLLAATTIALSLAVRAQAQIHETLALFNDVNGSTPVYGSLVQATDGNYYGTTYSGGKYGRGVVFQVTPTGTLSDIYSFCAQTNCIDGENPWSSIVLGRDGNLYGTTNIGGSNGAGTVFKMTLKGKLSTLYSFCPTAGCTDGKYPVGLMQATNGNFYGTTSDDGANNPSGTIFEITSAGRFKLLYTFCSKNNCTDGSYPLFGPMQARNGNLYGTTSFGGSNGEGTFMRSRRRVDSKRVTASAPGLTAPMAHAHTAG